MARSLRVLSSRLRLGWLVGLAVLLAGCRLASRSSLEREVVVYTSVDQIYAEPILKVFEQRTGIKVRAAYDVEAAKVTGLVARLRAERDRPQADVFWNSEFANTLQLARDGLLAPYSSPAARALPARYKDAQGRWSGSCARARVLLANTRRLPSGGMPSSLQDLLSPRWSANGIGMANPLFGTAATQAAALYATRGPVEAVAFYKALRDRGIRVVDGNAVVRDLVVSGQLAFGLTDTDDAAAALRSRAPVRVIVPDQDGAGTLVIPSTVALVAGAPHVAEAKRLMDALLSAETEESLIRAGACQIPLQPTASSASKAFLRSIRPLQVSLDAVQEQLPQAHRELRELFLY